MLKCSVIAQELLKLLSVAINCSMHVNPDRNERFVNRRPLTFNIFTVFYSKELNNPTYRLNWLHRKSIDITFHLSKKKLPIILLRYRYRRRNFPKIAEIPNEVLLVDVSYEGSRAVGFDCIPNIIFLNFPNDSDFQCALFDFVVSINASSLSESSDIRFWRLCYCGNKQL